MNLQRRFAERIMFVGWRNRLPYDETTCLNSRKRRGSPLAHKLELHPAEAAGPYANNLLKFR